MRLFAFLADDGPALGLLTSRDEVVPLRSAVGGLDLVLADERLEEVIEEARGLATADARGMRRASLTPAPAIEFPSKVVCIGLNYRDHVAEGGRAMADRPILFGKAANAIVADGEAIVRPEGTRALDLEVELGVVIGRRARRVTADRALAHVAGYVVVNDVSARDWQGVPAALREGERGDGQWLRAKGSDTFLPLGSVFVPSVETAGTDGVDPAAGLRLRSWRIAGRGPRAGAERLMQDASTADMLWSVPELIARISAAITLEPGDVIATGTPGGVGVFRTPPLFLEPGDRVRCEIEGIGSVQNPVVDWSDVADDEA
jgi:2-keto-4-pentenoate hydratase/2-oxohepta-3-ene-1,7-dioic acid hydratase in catechol pathway